MNPICRDVSRSVFDEEIIQMVNYGLKDKVAIITGANNPQGIGATTAFAFAREGAKVVLVYKKIFRQFDENKTDKNGISVPDEEGLIRLEKHR